MTTNQENSSFVLTQYSLLENINTADVCLGNGYLLQQPDSEEFNSSAEPRGCTMSDIFLPDNTHRKFSVLPNWLSLYVRLNTEMLDLARCEMLNYTASLNRLEGVFERKFELKTACNHQIEVSVQRFLSLAQPEIAAIKYKIRSVNFEGKISFNPVIDGNDKVDAQGIAEPEWNVLQSKTQKEVAHLWIQLRKTNLQICQAMSFDFSKNNAPVKTNPTKIEKQKVAGFSFGVDVRAGESVCAYKYVAQLNSLKYPYKELTERACNSALEAKTKTWETLYAENKMAWYQFWKNAGFSPTIETTFSQQQLTKKLSELTTL